MNKLSESRNTSMDAAQHRIFLERFLKEQHRVYSYIMSLVLRRADAEELFQETSLLLWEKWGEFDQSRPLLPWACGIAHNLVRNHARKRRGQTVLLDEKYLEEVGTRKLAMDQVLDERRAALDACLQELPLKQRRFVEKCYTTDVSMKSLASREGTTANALYLKLRRLRSLLFDCVSQRLAGANE